MINDNDNEARYRAYRDYQTRLPDGTVAEIAITLCDLQSDTVAADFARSENAVAYGLISILGVEGAPEDAILWLQLPDQIALTVTNEDSDLGPELMTVIGDQLAKFFADVADVAPELSKWSLRPRRPN